MTIEKLNDTLRIVSNLDVLLKCGVFAGEHAAAISEAQTFVSNLAQQLQVDIKAATDEREKARSSIHSEESSGGMGSSRVQNPKRKSSRRKNNPA